MENILSLVSKFGSTSHHHIVVKVCLWFCLISFKKNREILVYISHVKRKTFVKIIQFEKTKMINLSIGFRFCGISRRIQNQIDVSTLDMKTFGGCFRWLVVCFRMMKFLYFWFLYNHLLHMIKLDYKFVTFTLYK